MEEAIVVVGDYGSGKTEFSINLALHLSQNHQVILADLDIVNPYFRSREAVKTLEAQGVEVIFSREWGQADLPALSPRTDSALREDKVLILDVGGDDGSIVLGRYRKQLSQRQAGIWQVVNCMRPFTADVEGIMDTASRLEHKSGLAVSALVNNTNLGRETTAELVLEGAKIVDAAAARLDVPVLWHCARPALLDQLDARLDNLLPMEVSLFPADIT